MSKLAIAHADDYKFVVGMWGSSESDQQCIDFAREIVNTMKRPTFKGDLGLVILAVPKKPRMVRKLIDWTVEGSNASLIVYSGKNLPEYFSRGAGAQAALGSMFSGGSAISSVRAASKHAPHCGDGLNWVDTNLELDKWRIRTKSK